MCFLIAVVVVVVVFVVVVAVVVAVVVVVVVVVVGSAVRDKAAQHVFVFGRYGSYTSQPPRE